MVSLAREVEEVGGRFGNKKDNAASGLRNALMPKPRVIVPKKAERGRSAAFWEIGILRYLLGYLEDIRMIRGLWRVFEPYLFLDFFWRLPRSLER